MPSLAKVENADVIDSSVTSPDPSASDGTLGTEPTPIRCAYSTVTGMPTSSSIRTAARLLDVRSAVRIVIDGLSRCSSSGTHAPCERHDRLIELVDERGRRETALERGRIDERLERRARLALGLRGAIEGALREVAAADHRAHVAGVRVHGHERRLQRLLAGGLARALALLDLGERDEPTSASAAFCMSRSTVV